MKKIELHTSVTSLLADVYTPVGIYLRLRDRFRDTVLLESTDSHVAQNSWSFIGVNAIAGIELTTDGLLEEKLPGGEPTRRPLAAGIPLHDQLWAFAENFAIDKAAAPASFAQGFYGYFSFDAVATLHQVPLAPPLPESEVPPVRFRLYQYVIAINHHHDELLVMENIVAGVESENEVLLSLINNKDVPVYPFQPVGDQTSPITTAAYEAMVQKGIDSCHRGDVFQIVLSRRFKQAFLGDEFNVYRSLRHINPSPYLFYFDYGAYKIFGSSPEAQLIIDKGKATMFPIAGTFARTGNDAADAEKAAALLQDEKEGAEHVMLVDLARNDLSTICSKVTVQHYRQVQYYSHVIHLVSQVSGDVAAGTNPFALLFKTFPAGTLSGAPKHKAMQLIAACEPHARSFYGGTVGFVGFNGTCNTAIIIRSVLSKDNHLHYQAGAGVVARSVLQSESAEVVNKLNAVRSAIVAAQKIGGGVRV